MPSLTLTPSYWGIFLACCLPYFCTIIAKTKGRGFNNDTPREWLEKQTGWRARANAAQKNSFESLPFFLVAMLLSLQLGNNLLYLNAMAMVFVLLRIVYIFLYLANQATLRSIAWFLAFICNMAIFFSAWH